MANSYEQHQIKEHTVQIFRHYDGVTLYIADADGVQVFAHKVSGDPLAKAMEVLGVEPKFERRTLKTAQSQVLAAMLTETEGKNGGRLYKAWEKACTESEQNMSVQFESGVLSFVSRQSNEPRNVTKAGCACCPCGNSLSYHQVLFRIVERYAELKSNVRAFRPKEEFVHVTNEGQRIPLSQLSDDHLMVLLMKLRFSLKRFNYIAEAEKRGLIEKKLAA